MATKTKITMITWALLATGGLKAQFFTQLAAPGNGDIVYYALQFRPGTGRPGPIYRLASGSASLYVSFPPPTLPPKPILFGESSWYTSPFYLTSHPQFSRDGSVFAYTSSGVCLGGLGCFGKNLHKTTVQGAPGSASPVVTLPGTGWLSRNGRYLLTAPVDSLEGVESVLTDLVTNQGSVVHIKGTYNGPVHVIADDGTLFGTDTAIDASGRVAVGTSRDCDVTKVCRQTLHLHERATGKDSVFLQGNGDLYSPEVSADGQKIFFISTVQFGTNDPPGTVQLYSIALNHTGFTELTSGFEPSGVLEYAVSDDGGVVWYASGDGKLVKLTLGAGNILREAFSPPPIDLSAVIVPGSATYLASAIPACNVRITFDGVPAPSLSTCSQPGTHLGVDAVNGRSDTQDIVFQVPWELLAGQPVQMRVTVGGSSVEAKVIPTASNPALFSFTGGLGGTAIHGDWSAFVGRGNAGTPALPGEIVHFFGTGFGPVQPTVQTGVASPSTPFSLVADQFSCTAKVLYLGLAPGLIGYYQLTVQLPDVIVPNDPNYTLFDLSCGGPLLAAVPALPKLP